MNITISSSFKLFTISLAVSSYEPLPIIRNLNDLFKFLSFKILADSIKYRCPFNSSTLAKYPTVISSVVILYFSFNFCFSSSVIFEKPSTPFNTVSINSSCIPCFIKFSFANSDVAIILSVKLSFII